MEGGPNHRVFVGVNKKHGLAVFKSLYHKRSKVEQHQEAEKFCKENGVGAKQAFKSNPGKWPDINKDSLQRRLTGEVVTGRENQRGFLLTHTERDELACSMAAAAKCGFAFNKEDRMLVAFISDGTESLLVVKDEEIRISPLAICGDGAWGIDSESEGLCSESDDDIPLTKLKGK